MKRSKQGVRQFQSLLLLPCCRSSSLRLFQIGSLVVVSPVNRQRPHSAFCSDKESLSDIPSQQPNRTVGKPSVNIQAKRYPLGYQATHSGINRVLDHTGMNAISKLSLSLPNLGASRWDTAIDREHPVELGIVTVATPHSNSLQRILQLFLKFRQFLKG